MISSRRKAILVLSSFAAATIVTSIIAIVLISAFPLEGSAFAAVSRNGRLSTISITLETERIDGLVGVVCFPLTVFLYHWLRRRQRARSPEPVNNQEQGLLARGWDAVMSGLLAAIWVYGMYTLFIFLPTHPEGDVYAPQADWVYHHVTTRNTLVTISWVGVAVIYFLWRSPRSKGFPSRFEND
jgi:hypothetical protein